MTRLLRLNPVGIPQHIIQRGNNRQHCFYNCKDLAAYAHWLSQSSKTYNVVIHAWVFMSNHVHLLLTPNQENAISRMMQSLGRRYVQYFNNTHHRTGTLWEGRFKSCLIDSENYLLACYRYIELNPVRANIVRHPSEYYWSSYSTNAYGISSKLCTPHPLYLELGQDNTKRIKAYRDLFKSILSDDFIEEIRAATQRGLVVGNEIFKNDLEKSLKYSVRPRAVGRPSNPRNRL